MRSSVFLFILPTLALTAAFAACTSASEVDVTTSTGDTTDGGVTVILDGGGGIAPPPDGASLCPAGACNYESGDGCSLTDSCVPALGASGSSPACQPAGHGKSGDACDGTNLCAPRFVCVGTTCQQLCCGGDYSACDDKTQHCFTALEYQSADGGVVDTKAMICAPANTCDALKPSSCTTAGETCQIVDGTGATACVGEGSGDVGEACPCKGGTLCVANSCRRLCKAVVGGGDPFCQTGEGICVHFDRDPAGVGECTP